MRIDDTLYRSIIRSMPIPCVDLLVRDRACRILMVRRADPPAAGHWWFPGGRVHYCEPRETAARRKLHEECGLEAADLREVGTYDIILDRGPDGHRSHAISTVYEVRVDDDRVQLDEHSSEFAWKSIDEWRPLIEDEFPRRILDRHAAANGGQA